MTRPSFLDAYLVASGYMGSPVAGVVRRDRHVWRVFRFGVAAADQPLQAFATREEAGSHLLSLGGEPVDVSRPRSGA